MYRLTCDITVGKTKNLKMVNSVQITGDIETLTDTCVITFPRRVKVDRSQIRDHIKRGDAVEVRLGYDGNNERVFKGYVRDVPTGTPLVIGCEDEMFALKKIKVATRHYDKLSLKALIDEYLPSDIERNVVDMNLGEFRISDEPSLAKVLDYIKQNYPVRFFFRDNKFYAVLPTTMVGADTGFTTTVFKFGWNIIRDNLKYRVADDIDVVVKVKSIGKDNKKTEVQEPVNGTGSIRTYLLYNRTESEMREYARERLKEVKTDGLDGSFEAFGVPLVRVADRVKFIDEENPERNGKTYLVKGVRRQFGVSSGYRQTIELGYRI